MKFDSQLVPVRKSSSNFMLSKPNIGAIAPVVHPSPWRAHPAGMNTRFNKEYLSITDHATKVLVVNDHELSRDLFCKLLTSAGYAVRAASDGRKSVIAGRTVVWWCTQTC